MTDQHPKTISKYRIDGVLGKGAMGIVYLGFDQSIERKVAIKTIAIDSEDSAMTQEYTNRFSQEAKSLAQCTHPNIITILEYGHEDQMAYIVMEYIEGQNLTERLRQPKGIKLMQVISYFTQLLKALHIAHQQNIIHRDIKPDNVLLVNNKSIKLTDFGIAKSTANDGFTQMGMTVGTPKYMAPEQLYGNDEIGPYSDIYCLFVMLYEMLAYINDAHLFEMSIIPTMPQMAKHNKFNNDTLVPSCMISFISKGLAASHQDRYQNIQQVVKSFKPILHQLKQQNQASANNKGQSNPNYEATDITEQGTIITQSDEAMVVDEDRFAKIREHLSEIMGPMADFILAQALKNNHQYSEFIAALAEQIENNDLRLTFVSRWQDQDS